MGIAGYIGMTNALPYSRSSGARHPPLITRTSPWKKEFNTAIKHLELAEKKIFEAEKSSNPALFLKAINHIQNARAGVRGASKNAVLPEDVQMAKDALEKLNAMWTKINPLTEQLQ